MALTRLDRKAFGERVMAFQWLTPDRQTAEIHIREALINHFNVFGTARIVPEP